MLSRRAWKWPPSAASTYVFGAICPKHGKAVGLILPWCNTMMMNLHFAAISADVAPEALIDHCCDAWNKLEAQPWTIMSIGLRDWALGSGKGPACLLDGTG